MNKKPGELPQNGFTTPGAARIHLLEVIGNSHQGGMENYILHFIRNLPSNLFQVTCICPNESKFTAQLRQLGVEEVYIAPVDDDPRWRSIQLAAEVVKLHKIDILHAHMPRAHILAGLAGLLTGKPVVATVHGMNMTSQELGVYRAVKSSLICNCTEAYTQALAMGVNPAKLWLVKNGVDIPKESSLSGNTLRQSFNIPADAVLVGFVGRLDHEKGPDQFLRIAEKIHHNEQSVHFVLVGDGLMREELEEMCKSHKLENHVHFAGWWPNPQDVYPSLDILVHTSRSDGTSLVLLEAMAYGKPTVAIGVGGVREIVEDAQTGMMVGEGDWQAAAHALGHLLDRPLLRQKMGAAARQRVSDYFNVKKNTQQTAKIIRKLALSHVTRLETRRSSLTSALKSPVKPNGS